MKTRLTLFKSTDSPKLKRRRLIFLAVWCCAAAMVLWPIYPVFSGVEPLILGLPLAFAWVILTVLVMFVALLWLYLGEES